MPKPNTESRGRVAVVTGANRGIGLETCRQLLNLGLRVVMTGRDGDAFARARAKLGGSKEQLAAVRMDVTDPASISAAHREIARFGDVDVLVNNAAVLLFETSDLLSTYAPAYSISKAALNAFTRILAATYRGQGVLANVVDPGWVRTDMGGRAAPRPVEKGAETIVWLATLPDDGPNGAFYHDRKPVEW